MYAATLYLYVCSVTALYSFYVRFYFAIPAPLRFSVTCVIGFRHCLVHSVCAIALVVVVLAGCFSLALFTCTLLQDERRIAHVH